MEVLSDAQRVYIMKKRNPVVELLLWVFLVAALFAVILLLRPMFNLSIASDILTMLGACCIGCFVLFCIGLRRYFKGRKLVAFLLALLGIPLSIAAGTGMMCALNASQVPELRAKVTDSFAALRQDDATQSYIASLYRGGKDAVEETPVIRSPFAVAQRPAPTEPWEIMDKGQFDALGIKLDDPGALTTPDRCNTLILLEADKENRYKAQDFSWSNGQEGRYCAVIATVVDTASGKVFAPVYCASAPLKPDGESLLYRDLLTETKNDFPRLLDTYRGEDGVTGDGSR